MEPARIPLLLRAFTVQRLRVCDRGHADAAPAHRASKPRREEICSRLGYRPAGAELGLPGAGKSESLNREFRQGVEVDLGSDVGFVRPTSSSGAPRCFAMKSLGFSQPSVFSRYPGPINGVMNSRISKWRCAKY